MRHQTYRLWKRYELSLSALVIQTIALIYFLLSFFANTDLSKYPELLTAENRLTFHAIKHPHVPPRFRPFLPALALGSDHRFGVLFVDWTALMTSVPSFLFGD